jgi:hypothetical protein
MAPSSSASLPIQAGKELSNHVRVEGPERGREKPGGFKRPAPTSPEKNKDAKYDLVGTDVSQNVHRMGCLKRFKMRKGKNYAMSHCGTAQFTLKLAASVDSCPIRSMPPLNTQLGTYGRHGSEVNEGKQRIMQISPVKHR